MMDDLTWCINYLKKYNGLDKDFSDNLELNFRGLQNITMPYDLSDEFYVRQDRVLQNILKTKTVTDVNSLPFIDDKICLYKGDITLLKSDAIVNACNSKLLGCFAVGHHCIDNAIHSFAGLEVRRDLMAVMDAQGHDEPNGQCKVTSGYNLPSKYILHTVGPIYSGIHSDDIDLFNCYESCMKKADDMGLKTIVFCALSTGAFGFPIERATRIAIKCVKNYLKRENANIERVVFNVFSNRDYDVYERTIRYENQNV